MTNTRAPVLEPVPLSDKVDLYEFETTADPPLVKGSDRDKAAVATLESFGLRVQMRPIESETKHETQLTDVVFRVAVARGNELELKSEVLRQALLDKCALKIKSVCWFKCLTPSDSAPPPPPRMNAFALHLYYNPPIRVKDERDKAVDDELKRLGARFLDRGLTTQDESVQWPVGVDITEAVLHAGIPEGREAEFYTNAVGSRLWKHGCKITKIEFLKCLTPSSDAAPPSQDLRLEKKLDELLRQPSPVVIRDELRELKTDLSWTFHLTLLVCALLACLVMYTASSSAATTNTRVDALYDRQFNATLQLQEKIGLQWNTTRHMLDRFEMLRERGLFDVLVIGFVSGVLAGLFIWDVRNDCRYRK
jgi:hypothetical protein